MIQNFISTAHADHTPEHTAETPAAEVAPAAAAEHAADTGHTEAGGEAHTATVGHGEHAGAHEVHIPWNSIGVQAFNLFFLVALLTYLLRKTVKAHFATRAAEYQDLVNRADAAKTEAEAKHRDMTERMAKLEQSAVHGIQQARKDAEEVKAKLIQEAKEASVKLAEDAKRSAAIEIEKAKAELRRELLDQALSSSKALLKTGLGSGDQEKLQNEFAEKIQAVRQ